MLPQPHTSFSHWVILVSWMHYTGCELHKIWSNIGDKSRSMSVKNYPYWVSWGRKNQLYCGWGQNSYLGTRVLKGRKWTELSHLLLSVSDFGHCVATCLLPPASTEHLPCHAGLHPLNSTWEQSFFLTKLHLSSFVTTTSTWCSSLIEVPKS